MSGNSSNRGLTFSIIFASLVLSGSIVFFGLQMSGDSDAGDLQTEIRSGIENYVQEQQQGAGQPSQQAPDRVSGDFTDDDAFLGDDDAPVTIVEFSDYQCPYCARFYKETLPQIKEKYIETGKVKFVYRDYPLQSHPGALPAAMITECARAQGGDEAFFAMHDRIFDTIDGGFDDAALIAYAGTIGVDTDKLQECYDNEDFKDEVNADLQDGVRAGVSGTPGFLINGMRVSGAQPFGTFESLIEAALAE